MVSYEDKLTICLHENMNKLVEYFKIQRIAVYNYHTCYFQSKSGILKNSKSKS